MKPRICSCVSVAYLWQGEDEEKILLFSWIKAAERILDEHLHGCHRTARLQTRWSYRPWCIAADETSQQMSSSFNIYSSKITRELSHNMTKKNWQQHFTVSTLTVLVILTYFYFIKDLMQDFDKLSFHSLRTFLGKGFEYIFRHW